MAKVIGNLAINITASSAGLARALNQSSARVQKFAQGVNKAFGPRAAAAANAFAGGVRNVALGVGIATTAVAGLTGAVLGGLKGYEAATAGLDELAKSADRLQTAPEILRQLQFAAEQSGSSFDTLSRALVKLQEQIGAGLAGSSRAVVVEFEKLGLSLQQVSQLDAAEQLKVISDALLGLPTAAERARSAVVLFGRGGRDLATLLAQGSAGIEELRQRAEDLGLTLDRDALAAVERARDSINELFTVLGALKDRILAEAAPAIETFTAGLTSAIEQSNGGSEAAESFGNVLQKLAEIAIRVGQGVADAYNLMVGAITESFKLSVVASQAFLGALANFGIGAVNAVAGAAEGVVNAIIEGVNFASRQINRVIRLRNDLESALPDFLGTGQLGELGEIGRVSIPRLSNLEVPGLAEVGNQLNRTIDTFAEKSLDLVRSQQELRFESEKVSNALERQTTVLEGSERSLGSAGGAASRAAESVRELREELEKVEQVQGTFERSVFPSSAKASPNAIGKLGFEGIERTSPADAVAGARSQFSLLETGASAASEAISGIATSFLQAGQASEDFGKKILDTVLGAIQQLIQQLIRASIEALFFRSALGGQGTSSANFKKLPVGVGFGNILGIRHGGGMVERSGLYGLKAGEQVIAPNQSAGGPQTMRLILVNGDTGQQQEAQRNGSGDFVVQLGQLMTSAAQQRGNPFNQFLKTRGVRNPTINR